MFKIYNKNHTIYGLLQIPEGLSNIPCLIMLHGTGSDMHEVNNIYDDISNSLNELGIATCRFDFIGTGLSDSDYINYTIKNCLSDLHEVYNYLTNHELIDSNNIHLMGFSQGASISMLAKEKYKSVILLNPTIELNKFLTADEQQICNNIGYITKDFSWRDPLKFSKEWLHEVNTINFLDEYSQSNNDTLIICSGSDDIVDPKNSNLIYQMSSSINTKLQYIDDANHILNIYETNQYYSEFKQSLIEWIKEYIEKKD